MSVTDGKEITFRIDKYNKTALLTDKDTLVQIILNALLMIPGNLPSQPLKGVNLFQYLYRSIEPEEMATIIHSDLIHTVGGEIGTAISNLTVDIIDLDGRGPVFLLIIHLSLPDDSDENLALAVQKVDEMVKFNYSFLTDAIKNMR